MKDGAEEIVESLHSGVRDSGSQILTMFKPLQVDERVNLAV